MIGLPAGHIQTLKKPTAVLSDKMKGIAINVRATRILNKLCAIPFQLWWVFAELPFCSLKARGTRGIANDLQLACANLFQGEMLVCGPLRIRLGIL